MVCVCVCVCMCVCVWGGGGGGILYHNTICILSQSYKATCYGPEFYTTNCCRIVYAGKFAQLIIKNLLFTDNMLSAAWFG